MPCAEFIKVNCYDNHLNYTCHELQHICDGQNCIMAELENVPKNPNGFSCVLQGIYFKE